MIVLQNNKVIQVQKVSADELAQKYYDMLSDVENYPDGQDWRIVAVQDGYDGKDKRSITSFYDPEKDEWDHDELNKFLNES